MNANECYELLTEVYHNLCEKHIPKKKPKTNLRSRAPWITKEVRDLSHRKARLELESQELTKEYTDTKRQLKRACDIARNGYENKLTYDKKTYTTLRLHKHAAIGFHSCSSNSG